MAVDLYLDDKGTFEASELVVMSFNWVVFFMGTFFGCEELLPGI
jgi:hypothetical protein